MATPDNLLPGTRVWIAHKIEVTELALEQSHVALAAGDLTGWIAHKIEARAHVAEVHAATGVRIDKVEP